jgi:molybdenum cofactor cytidylyltransferase
MARGIILAAGTSSRANTNKLLLEYEGLPLIVHAIRGMLPFVYEIVVVTGRYHDELTFALKDVKGIRIVKNPNYEKGMFSSLLTGLHYIDDDVLILPGDCPFVSEMTYEQILETQANIVVPEYKGIKGHPMLIRKPLLWQLRQASVDSNLRAFRDETGYQTIRVDDPNIIVDIDTIGDYQTYVKEHTKGS